MFKVNFLVISRLSWQKSQCHFTHSTLFSQCCWNGSKIYNSLRHINLWNLSAYIFVYSTMYKNTALSGRHFQTSFFLINSNYIYIMKSWKCFAWLHLLFHIIVIALCGCCEDIFNIYTPPAASFWVPARQPSWLHLSLYGVTLAQAPYKFNYTYIVCSWYKMQW